MPLVIHPRVRKAVRRLTATTCVAMFVGTGAALASPCGHETTSTPFAQFGDTSSYFLVPGGDFTGTAAQTGWTLQNAGLTAADAPDLAGTGTETQALVVNGGGSAVSPTFCVDATMPTLRFLAKQATGGAGLAVNGVVTVGWHTFVVPITTIADGSMPAWAPTASIKLPTQLPHGVKLPVRLQFRVAPGAASWAIGDVYVDPWRAD